MRTVCTIEARMQSTRLPGKVLKPILGRPMLALLIERLKMVPELDEVVIATTVHPSCDEIQELAGNLGVGYYRGSEEDVLLRVLEAGRAHEAGLMVQTTGDCPLIDPATISKVIHLFNSSDCDFATNVLTADMVPLTPGENNFPSSRTYPVGMDVRVFPLSILEKVAKLTNDPVDHEHATNYIWEHPDRFKLVNLDSDLPVWARQLRLTVDTPEDFDLITRIFEELYPSNAQFSLADILSLMERHPELQEINQNIQQKAVR